MSENYIPENDELVHYGTKEHSGRYPWGSGEQPYQRLGGLYGEYRKAIKEGLTPADIAAQQGISVNELRARIALYNDSKTQIYIGKCCELAEQGLSNVKIAKKLGISEGAVRNYLKTTEEARKASMINVMNALADEIAEHKYIDVGDGTEARMNITKTKLDQAVINMVDEGYYLDPHVKLKIGGSGGETSMKVLAAPGTTSPEIYANRDAIAVVNARSEDGGAQEPLKKPEPPANISLKRITIRYADDPQSGKDMDGVIELRRGVEDLSLGNGHYAQVRIAVDGKYYAKGMAVYADDLPDGCDIRINSNKKRGAPLGGDGGVLKDQAKKPGSDEVDEENPFAASIKDPNFRRMTQQHYIGKDGKEHLSALNVVTEEGDWEKWSRNLPSQFLSKQAPALAKQQLDIEAQSREAKYQEIAQITNPTLRRKMLLDFAGDCDGAAVKLKAASLPRQQVHVILPVPELKENEIYAPNYEPGEKVALVRYPHGGIFEIPVLTVNNNNKAARSRITPQARDAVGIHPSTAEVLSGADFDGDTVTVIPLKSADIATMAPLEGLKNFDTKTMYATTKEDRDSGRVKIIKAQSTSDTEMGKITNLITDMTLTGEASPDELARAVRHSMVIIDAKKHKLDYKRSEKDNRIQELKDKYQAYIDPETGQKRTGAGTLISRASSEVKVPERRPFRTSDINPDGSVTKHETGKMKKTGKVVTTKDEEGNTVPLLVDAVDPKTGKVYKKKAWEDTGYALKTQKSTRMAETDDAYTLTSGGSKKNPGTKIEGIYAEYANRMKALANQARKDTLTIEDIPLSKSAKDTYAVEAASLRVQVNEAKKNSPLERQAQSLAMMAVNLKLQDNPLMTSGERSKALDKELKRARQIVGASRYRISITDKEWEAIQAGALPKTTVEEVFRFADQDRLHEIASPKERKAPSAATLAAIKSMISRGYTREEIANRFDISTSTLSKYLDMKGERK